jgi:hypothetical protein
VDKINEFVGELKDPETSPEEQIVALKFVLHPLLTCTNRFMHPMLTIEAAMTSEFRPQDLSREICIAIETPGSSLGLGPAHEPSQESWLLTSVRPTSRRGRKATWLVGPWSHSGWREMMHTVNFRRLPNEGAIG